MKRLLLLTLFAGLLMSSSPALAAAKSSQGFGYVSPGQSAGAQYTEDVPTAGGDTPAQAVHARPEADVGSRRTITQLNRSATGAATAYLAASLAPQRAALEHRSRPRRTAHERRQVASTSTDRSAGRAATSQAAIQVGQTFSGGSDLDTWLIAVLALVLVLVSTAGIARMRIGRRESR